MDSLEFYWKQKYYYKYLMLVGPNIHWTRTLRGQCSRAPFDQEEGREEFIWVDKQWFPIHCKVGYLGSPNPCFNILNCFDNISKKVRIQLNLPVKSEQKIEVEDTHKTVEEDRKLLMQVSNLLIICYSPQHTQTHCFSLFLNFRRQLYGSWKLVNNSNM